VRAVVTEVESGASADLEDSAGDTGYEPFSKTPGALPLGLLGDTGVEASPARMRSVEFARG
jgi:hypothetical protein